MRTETGEITHETRIYSQTLERIRAGSDILIQGSTGGFEKKLDIDQRCSAVDDPRTDVASLNMGSVNLGDEIAFVNTGAEVRYWARKFAGRRIVPEMEVFDSGHLNLVHGLIQEGVLKPPFSVNFALGYFGGARASIESILHLRALLPEGAFFGISHNGMPDFALLAASIAAGAQKIRIGFEDSIFYAPGHKARTNLVLVEKVVEMIRAIGGEPMGIAEARAMYGAKAA